MAKIFITYQIPSIAQELLEQAGHTVTVHTDEALITRDTLLQSVKEYDAVLSLLTEKIDQEVLAAAGPQLKIIANYAVGFDNIDVKAAQVKHITITNTPDVLNEAVAEHAISLLVAVARRIVEADRFTRAGKYKGWRPLLLLGTQLKDKTIGIVGLGRIGTAVARRAKLGFGMKIAYNDIKPNAEFEAEFGATFYSELDAMLPHVDALSLHVPLIDATHHLINKERLAHMKTTAFLINTSRGPVIDEYALVQALRSHTIAGAALDVFEQEPELASGLDELENVVVTPHIASATIETRTAMAELAAKNIIAVLEGKLPLTPVT